MTQEESYKYFKENIDIIRQSSGLTEGELAEKVGIKRQSLNRIINGGTLTIPMYLALDHVLRGEIKKHKKETGLLQTVLDAFVDNREKYTDDQRKEIKEQVDILVPAMYSRFASKAEVCKTWQIVLSAIAGVAVGALSGFVIGSSIKKIGK